MSTGKSHSSSEKNKPSKHVSGGKEKGQESRFESADGYRLDSGRSKSDEDDSDSDKKDVDTQQSKTYSH